MNHPVPFIGVQLFDRRGGSGDPSVIDQNIQAAQRLCGRRHHSLYV